MSDEPLLVTVPRPGVALITFNAPRTLNAMTTAFVTHLQATLGELAQDLSTRVIVLTGAGRGFCSGHSLDDLQHSAGGPAGLPAQIGDQQSFSTLITQINELPQPVIAAVNGPAAGAGLAMALACDTRVCSRSARFGAAFIRVGLSGCDVGVSYLLPRFVGPTLAFEMMLTGRLIDADEALRSGLVIDVVADGTVVDAALGIADQIVGNSPFGVRMTKRAMWHALDAVSLRHAIELEDRTQVLCAQSGDGAEAIAALREKRPANWG